MKRAISMLLALCMVISMLPSVVLAAEEESVWTETLTLPLVSEGEELPKPQGYGGGVSMFRLTPNNPTYAYAYEGVSHISLSCSGGRFTFAVEEGVTPTSGGVLQVVSDEGEILAGSQTASYYKDYNNEGSWYLHSVYFDDASADASHQFADIPAGEYTLQVAVGEERYTVDQKLCVVDSDSLLIDEASAYLYEDSQTAEVYMEIYGLKTEAELAKMSLTLNDEDGNAVARSTGALRECRYHDYGYWRFYMELALVEGQKLQSGIQYSLTISDTSQRTLVDGVGGVTSYAYDHSTELGDVWFSDAQNGVLSVELCYPEASAYEIKISDDWGQTTVYGSWRGTVPENGVIEIPLTMNGLKAAAGSYPGSLYVSWKLGSYSSWQRESVENPYRNSGSMDVNFQPYTMSVSYTKQPFMLEVRDFDGYKGDGTDLLTLCSRDGKQVASCSDFEEEWNGDWTILTGTLTLPKNIAENKHYDVFFNGVDLGSVYVTGDLSVSRWEVEYQDWSTATIWTNFGVLPVSAETVNSSGTARYELRDADGNVCLTTGNMTKTIGDYAGYVRYDGVFQQKDLAEYAGETLSLWYVDGTYSQWYKDYCYDGTVSDIVFNNNVGNNQDNVYIEWWGLEPGDTAVQFHCYNDMRNVTEATLLDRMQELRLVCGEKTLTVSGLALDTGDDYYHNLTLSAPITVGDWELYDGDAPIYTFEVEAPNAADSAPYVSTYVEQDGGYLWCRNLPADSEYTAKVYQNYTCLSDKAFSLTLWNDEEGEQRLRLPRTVIAELERGEYELRIYQDGVLLGSAELSVEGALQPTITINDNYGNNWSDRIIHGKYLMLEVGGSHSWTHYRAAESEAALEDARWYELDTLWSLEDTETVGERTLCVQLSEDADGEKISEVVELSYLYLGEDGLMDVYVHEEVEGLYSGDTVTLSMGADYPYAYAMMDLVDGDGSVTCVPLTYQGKGKLPGLSASGSGDEIIGSAHPYSAYMNETYSYTLEGAESIQVTFSDKTCVESGCDYLYVYYVENGRDVFYNGYTGSALAGQTLTLPGDTVKVRLTSDVSVQEYGFGITSVVDPDAPPAEGGEDGEPIRYIYSTQLDTADHLGTEKLCFYLVENENDDGGYRRSLVSQVVERSLIFGDPTTVILPQFEEDEEYLLTNKRDIELYGYGIPGSTVTLTYSGGKETEDVTLGTATAGANGKFTMKLTDLEDGVYYLTATSEKDGSRISGNGTLKVDTTAPEITAMGFAFSDDDTATLNWTCRDEDLVRSTVYLVTEDGEQRLGYVYPSSGADGVFSRTVTASNNDGQRFKVVVVDEAGNTASRTISTSDQEPPTAPGQLTCTSRTAASVTLSWTAGKDNVGVAGYTVYRNGEKIGQTIGENVLTYHVTELEQGTEYTFSVATRDLAGNFSVEANPELTVSTAKLGLDAAIPGTVTTNGSDVLDVKVLAALTSDTEEYSPSAEHIFIRYQQKNQTAEPDEDQWTEKTLSSVSLNGKEAEGTWKMSLPSGAELPLNYWVQVVVTDGEGVTVYSEPKTLTLVDGRVTFHVKDSKTGEPIPGADVSVYRDGKLLLSGTAGTEGKTMLGLEDGSYSLVAQAEGYQMRSIPSVTVSADRLEFTVYMNTEDILEVTTSVKEMTYEEIVAAGIDPAAAGNQHVYQCTAILDFTPITYICAGDQVIQGDPVKVGDYIVYPAARDIFLIVPTQTTWLKEMFDVQLLVTNSSAFEDVEDCVAKLTLPTGLSLAEMSTGSQSVTAELGTITPGGSASHHWYVRGDAEGDYTLQGTVTGTRVGGGLSEDLSIGFTTQDPISVLAGSAMKLTIEAEKTATIGQPYKMRFTLRNVSAKSLYNVNFDVLGGTFRQEYTIEDVLASYDLEGPFKADADLSGLSNGFVLSAAEFKPADVLSGVFTITFGEGISDPDATEYMLKRVFLFTGAGSTTEIPTEVIWVDSISDHVHEYDDGVVTNPPTCTEAGEKTFTCTDSNCSETMVVVLPAIGHNMSAWTTTKYATCTESGSAQSECTNEGCSYTEILVLNPLGHSFGEEWTTDLEPTCTAEGSKSRHCTRNGCNAREDVTVIPANGHSFGSWEKHDGAQHKHICTVETCKFVEYDVHKWNAGEETTAPTHLTEGVRTYTCTVCGETKTEAIAKLPDHTWSDWEKISDTQHKRSCNCGESEMADHIWGDWDTVTEPTCTKDGQERRDCSDCDAYETKPVPATGHSWDSGKITKEPTLTEEGARTYTCTVCFETKTESIAKLKKQEMYFSVNLLGRDMVKTYGDPNFVDMIFNDSVENPVLVFTSSDESVATVDADGYVTIRGAGETIISAVSAPVPYQYAETTASYKLIVKKAELTVTANDVSLVYGEAFAPKGYTAEGFVYNETADVLAGEIEYTCEYEQYGTVGEYPIAVSGFTSENYNITFISGKLTVGKADVYSISFGNLSHKSDAVTPVIAAVTPQDETAVIRLEYKVQDQWTTVLPLEVGTYPVRAELIASDNLTLDGKLYGDQMVIEATDSIGGVSVSVKTEEDKATVEVTDEEVAQIVESLENSNGNLAVNLESVEKDTLILPGNLVEELNKSDDLETVTVTTGASSIAMSDTVLNTMADAMDQEDTVALQMNIQEMEDLDEAQQEALESIGGPSPQTVVVELKLTVTDAEGNVKKEIKELGDQVDITIQCSQEMQGKRLVACYISPDGTVTYLVAKYDEATNTLSFKTDHFSTYAAVEVGEGKNVVYVVDDNGMELPAVGAGPQTVGETVTVQAPTAPSGYRFSGWEVEGGTVTLTDDDADSVTFTMPDEDVILVATFSRKSSAGSGSSSATYGLTVAKTENGTVTLSSSKAEKGSTVTITVTPDKGYRLAELTVTDRSGNELKLTKKSAGKYTFKMPDSKVKIEASFVRIGEDAFADVHDGDYFYDAVLWAAENGITTGVTPVTFEPGAVCSRAQVVTFLWRAAGCPEPETAKMPFADVPAGAYYYDAVLWAVENGITAGVSNTSFAPNAIVTRGQVVTFLWRAEGSDAAESRNVFTDVQSDAYYCDAVLWAVENGVTNGVSDTLFAPANGCTRGQIVTFLYRSMAK